jgi:hypothetical protein
VKVLDLELRRHSSFHCGDLCKLSLVPLSMQSWRRAEPISSSRRGDAGRVASCPPEGFVNLIGDFAPRHADIVEIVLGQLAQFAPHHVTAVPQIEDVAHLAERPSEQAKSMMIYHQKNRFAHDDLFFRMLRPWISGAEPACDSSPERFGRFVQRLLPGHADVLEQVRIIGEFAQRRVLSTPSGPSPHDTPCDRRGRSPI